MIYIRNIIKCSLILITGNIVLFGLTPNHLMACGWWGDGELNRDDDIALTGEDGKSLPRTLSIQNAKLPGRMGYGIAVTEPGLAIPYLQATRGHQVNSIAELKTFGFKTVIDLGTPVKEARLHQLETETLGIHYINIPIEGNLPSKKQLSYFTQQVVNHSSHNMLLVYAPNATLLGTMWAAYRINLGAPLEFAIKQGKKLGMENEQESALLIRLSR
jgi:hypothetical protein